MKLNASNRDSKLPEASRASLDPSILRSRIKAHFQACSWLLPSFFTKAWATGKRVAISTLAISWKCKATPLNYLLNGHQPYDFCFNGEWTEPNWWLNWDQSATSMFQAVHRDLTAALLVEGKRPGWILRCFFDILKICSLGKSHHHPIWWKLRINDLVCQERPVGKPANDLALEALLSIIELELKTQSFCLSLAWPRAFLSYQHWYNHAPQCA